MAKQPQPGDRIEVQANAVLGTPASQATIVRVEPWGFTVRCDDDGAGWHGPVDRAGNVLAF